MGQMALLGLVVFGVNFALQIVGQAGGAAAQASGEPAIFFGFMAINTIVGMIVQTWINVGATIFVLKAARNEGPTINDLGAAGPFLVRVILMQILIGLILMGVAIACLAPAGILALVTREQAVGVTAAIIGGVIAAVVGIALGFRWMLASYFIIDCKMAIGDAMSSSGRFMAGNKLIAFLVLLVTGLGGLVFALLTCCLGYVLVVPYMTLTMAAVYLSATGQPWGPTLGGPRVS
jgi:hypothetical protein